MSEQLIQTPGVFGENGNFLLERELGRGGMGGVYMGRDKMLDRPVAVKVMLREYGDDPEFVEKFKREAQAAARLIHPNIAQIYSYGISDGMPYIAMELVAGGSLDSLMRQNPGKTEVPRVMKICEQVAQALRCAADQGLVHGDVKPDNILLDANGNAKLVDFGLAGMQKDTDEIWGTPYYISPEKVQRQPIDYRADMYSLGGTLYHALTGVAPFEGADTNAVVRARFDGPPKKPSEVRAGLSPEIDNLVMTMLALDRDARYPSFEALVEEFRNVMTVGLGSTQTVRLSRPDAGGAAGVSGGDTVKRKRLTVRSRRPGALKRPEAGGEDAPEVADIPAEAEPEEESGGIGGKVVAVVLGVLLVVGGIAGGLLWYVRSDRESRVSADSQKVTSGIGRLRQAIAHTRESAEKWIPECESMAERAVAECERHTKRLQELLPDFADQVKPPETQELVEARAAREPAAAAPVAATNAAPAAAESAPEAVAAAPSGEVPNAVKTMQELWVRAYGCQASAIRLRTAVDAFLADCDRSAEVTGDSLETMRTLEKTAEDLKTRFGDLCSSEDVKTLQTGVSYIRSRGENAVKKTVSQLTVERNQKERAEAKAREEEARLQQEKDAAEAKARLIEEEKSAAKEKFQAIVDQKTLRVLAWDTAIRSLEFLRGDFKTTEGRLAVDDELRKVKAMKSVQEIFVRNLKGYAFRKSSLAKLGCTVKDVDETELKMAKRDGKPMKLTWVKFYQEYHGNLNELIIHYVEGGRKNGEPKLTLREWADAMCGAALTMTIVCSDDASAVERGTAIAKEVYAKYPEYQKFVQGMFPGIEFEGGSEE